MSTEYEPVVQPSAPQRRSDQPYGSILKGEPPDSREIPARQRAPRISRDEVFATADTLLVEGLRPTIDRVRVRLGRGSPNTINDHLDAWWLKLGSRLRDLPGREFPQLPERLAARLQGLWNEALETAHETLQSTLAERESALAAREQALLAQQESFLHEQASNVARAGVLEDALALARSQLDEANQRARTLEDALQRREQVLIMLRAEKERLTQEQAALQERLESERAAQLADRTRLEERHEATENRWLGEVDRTRQTLKAAEQGARELQIRLERITTDRETLRGQVQELKSQLRIAQAVRQQLEARLKTAPTQRSHSSAKRRSTRTRT